MSHDNQEHRKSSRPMLLFFIFAGVGALCLCGLLVLSHFGNRLLDRCFDETSEHFIHDEAERAKYCK